jgi:hypothetical protein
MGPVGFLTLVFRITELRNEVNAHGRLVGAVFPFRG